MKSKFELKNTFNLLLLLFIIIVPLFPMKVKMLIVPMSADFIVGGALIIVGFICFINMYRKDKSFLKLFEDKCIKSLVIFTIIYTVISFSSIIYAGHKGAVISEGVRFLEYAFIFFFIITISDSETIDRGLKAFYVTMILASIYGVIQYLFNWSEFPVGGFWGRGRIYATFVNPNYWGAAVNMVIFFPIINIVERKKIIVNISIFTLFFFNLFFSSTRGSWLGFAIGILAIGIIKYRKLVAFAFSLFLTMFLLPITRNRFLEMLNVSERLSLWKTGLYMFKDNALFGVGNGNYIFKYEKYVKKLHKELYLGKSKFSVHNSYLKTLVELGIFGGIAFILLYLSLFNLVYKVFKYSVKYKKCALAFLCFGVSYLFQNLFNNLVFIPQLNVFVWIIVAMLYKGLYIENLAKQI